MLVANTKFQTKRNECRCSKDVCCLSNVLKQTHYVNKSVAFVNSFLKPQASKLASISVTVRSARKFKV